MHNVNVGVESRPGWILAIDTSSEQLGVALSDGQSAAELSWPAGRQQSAVLLPAIEALLARQGLTVGELGAIAVAIGPGTFNGLRAGLGTAKGLALGSGLPLIGVGTLAATVLPVLVPGRLAVGVVGAGRRRVVSAVYAAGADGLPDPIEVGAAHNGSIDDLGRRLAGLSGPLTLVGEVEDHRLAAMMREAGQADVWVPPSPARGRRPASVAAIGYARWRRGEVDDPDTLDAVYLHSTPRPAATAP